VHETDEPTFAAMAVALTLAKDKLGLDLGKTKIIADRIGLSAMGWELVVIGLEHDVKLVAAAQQLLKDISDLEPEVRALIARRKRSRQIISESLENALAAAE
jgi:hypothetical protein